MEATDKTVLRIFRSVLMGIVFLTPITLSAPLATETGSIQGTIRIVSEIPEEVTINPYPGMARASTDTEGQSAHQPGTMQNVVVYLENVNPPFTISPPSNPFLRQINMRFDPAVLPILAGQDVSFPNQDSFYHNVFSYSPTRRFDLGRYANGDSRTVRFDKPGRVQVFCEIHSDMAAVILVLENPHFTVPDQEGGFHLTETPVGKQNLVVWHPDIGSRSVDVRVSAGNTTKVELEL